MDVHVDGGRIHLQEDEVGRRRAFGNEGLIGLHHRLVQVRAAEIAAVDEEELVPQRLFRRLGPAHEAVDPDQGGIGLDVHHLAHELRAQEVRHAELEGLGLLQDMDVAAVVREREGDFGPGEGHALELLQDVAELHVVRLEELAAGGDVVEEVPDGEVGALGGGDFAGGDVFGTGEMDLHAHFVLLAAGPEDHIRDGGDGREGFPAEAEGGDLLQVLGGGDLGGGVALEAQHGVVRGHAAAVVDDLDEGAAGVGHRHGDLVGPRVHGVLHEFLHHGSGPLDDLSRGDHVRDVPGEYLQFHLDAEQAVNLGDIDQHEGDQQQGDDADDGLRAGGGGAGALVVAVAPGAADAAARDVLPFFLGFLVGAVHVTEHAAALLLFGIVVTGLVVEHPMFLASEETEIENCHGRFV